MNVKKTQKKEKRPENFLRKNRREIVFLACVVFLAGIYDTGHLLEERKAKEIKRYVPISVSSKKSGVLGENTQNSDFTSEDYKVKSITLGGRADFEFSNEEDAESLRIDDVLGELVVSEKDDTKIILNWRTNKAAISRLEYQKNRDVAVKTVMENDFGYSHTMVLSALDSGSVYNYVIKAVDRSGSELESDRYVFYSGEPNASLIDVLQNAVQKVFGWAIKG